MKHLISILLLALLAHARMVNAQQTPEWIKIAPADERFQVLMPQEPSIEMAEHTYVSSSGPRPAIGKLYSTSFEGSLYKIWSLETWRSPLNQVDEIQLFLDDYADFVWESLLKPIREAVPQTVGSRMGYKSELSMGVIPGREYSLTIGSRTGALRFYMEGARIYVLVALRSGENSAPIQNFFSGFLTKSPSETPFLPAPATADTDPLAQVFKGDEVTTKARVLSKPEPQYTEAARKYRVTGLVVLRGVFSTDGQLTSIRILKRLPHGLTQASLAAAKQIKFTPATKDGQPVLQFIQLEYNFKLF